MIIPFIAAAAIAATPITAPGPIGNLGGTFVDAGGNAPVVLIIPGSGPTDRDGNNAMGVKAAPYRLLAEALHTRGISSVRIDKRGMFGSKAAVSDANSVSLADYATDTRNWISVICSRTDSSCIWLAGHSEGGLIALKTAQHSDGICGVILIASPGRKLGDVLREQLKANPANAPVLDSALAAIESLEAGKRVDVAGINPALLPLFAPQVQGYLIDLMATDPAALAGRLKVPMLVIQGGEDLQVAASDADALYKAQPKSTLTTIPGMNHVLKQVPINDRAKNFAAYADESLPIDPTLVETMADFIRR